MTEYELYDLLNGAQQTAADEKLQSCLSLARKVARDANRIGKSDVEAIINAGWSEETAHDVISIAAFATFSNILVDGHGVAGSPIHFQKLAKALGPGGGYQGAKGTR